MPRGEAGVRSFVRLKVVLQRLMARGTWKRGRGGTEESHLEAFRDLHIETASTIISVAPSLVTPKQCLGYLCDSFHALTTKWQAYKEAVSFATKIPGAVTSAFVKSTTTTMNDSHDGDYDEKDNDSGDEKS